MILAFHKRRRTKMIRTADVRQEWLDYVKTGAIRKANKRGDALRQRVHDYLLARGEAETSLGTLAKVFGGLACVVPNLLTMAEQGMVEVCNNDHFRALPLQGARRG